MLLDAETEARVRKGEITRPTNSAFTRVINKEEVSVPYFSNVNALELVEKVFGVAGTVHGPFTDADPHLTNVEIGDFALPTWDVLEGNGDEDYYRYFELRKQEGLDVLTDRLTVHPDIIVPPALPKLPAEDSSLAVAAEKMFEAFEMLKGEEDRFVTGDIFRIFSPGIAFSDEQAIAQKRVNPRQGFWQLPIGYVSSEFNSTLGVTVPVHYSATFQLEPFSQSNLNKNNSLPIKTGNSLWFLLRHRPADAILSAFLGQIPGHMVLRKKATSQEEVIVWYWSNVKSPFIVNLYVRNLMMQQPGFRGVNTAMMLG